VTDVLFTIEATLVQLALLGGVLGALQWCFPNRADQRVFRAQWRTDLAFFLGQHLLWLAVEFACLLAVRDAIAAVMPAAVREAFASQPWILQAAEVVLGGDVVVYWYHRASHAVPFLWRFHRVHHSAPHMDWLAAHREHPVDGFLTQVAANLPALVVGVGVAGLGGLYVFRGLWAAFIHSNVRLPIGPLRAIVGAPELHHWHHVRTERTLHNFANVAPWTDLLFGTYHCPPDQQHEVGLPGKPKKSYLGWLLRPGSD
jgi:sterol desaturase/sphingolipid hydroxylase (fatty acid hydroxylase superfamily)